MSQSPTRRGPPLVSTTIGGLTEGIIGIVIAATVIVLNIAELFVLQKKGRKRKIPEDLILSLSLADFFVGLVYIIFGTSKIMLDQNSDLSNLQTVVKETRLVFSFTIVVSVVHLLVIAVERFYAMKCPLKYRTVVKRKRMTIIIVAIWIISILAIVLLAFLPKVFKSSPTKLGSVKGWLIFVTSGVMIFVYGYVAYYLFNGFQIKSSKASSENLSKKISYTDQKRDTIFCIGIVAAFILCSFLAAVGWLLPKRVDLVNVIGEFLLVSNSFINPILYFWKSHLSRKVKIPARPLEMIKWALDTGTDSKPSTPQVSHLSIDFKAGKSLSTTSTPASTPLTSRRNSPQSSNELLDAK